MHKEGLQLFGITSKMIFKTYFGYHGCDDDLSDESVVKSLLKKSSTGSGIDWLGARFDKVPNDKDYDLAREGGHSENGFYTTAI